MRLADLLTADAVSDARFATLEITGVSADSRMIRPGDLFVAVRGGKADGLDFVAQALAAGAAAVMAERPPPAPVPSDIAFVKVQDTRRALALAAAALFPRQPQVIAAVTGTSGKTSVAAFARQIWTSLGYAAASIGTVGLVSPQREVYGSLSPADVERLAARAQRSLKVADALTPDTLAAARRLAARASPAIEALFDVIDVILSPTIPCPVPPREARERCGRELRRPLRAGAPRPSRVVVRGVTSTTRRTRSGSRRPAAS